MQQNIAITEQFTIEVLWKSVHIINIYSAGETDSKVLEFSISVENTEQIDSKSIV